MKVIFQGGPLNGEKRNMDVYVDFIPIPAYGYDPIGRPFGYYRNIMPQLVTSKIKSQLPVLYVFHYKNLMYPAVSKNGTYHV